MAHTTSPQEKALFQGTHVCQATSLPEVTASSHPTGSRTTTAPARTIARINGIPLHAEHEVLTDAELRQRACTELLRQAAQGAGWLDASDVPHERGAISEAASAAIEALLEARLVLPDPTEESCRRYFAAHAARYRKGERVLARHILFAVTPGVEFAALRDRAQAVLVDLRCDQGSQAPADHAFRKPATGEARPAPEQRGAGAEGNFARLARELSNCPSGAQGGDLGWLSAADCAPEFARELFGHAESGVLPRLVRSRFGLHVVEVLQRDPGVEPAFEDVRGAIAQTLRQHAYVTALRRTLQELADDAQIEGVELEPAGAQPEQ